MPSSESLTFDYLVSKVIDMSLVLDRVYDIVTAIDQTIRHSREILEEYLSANGDLQ